MSRRCSICGDWLFRSQIFGKSHKCPPSWWCWISDLGWDYDRDDDGSVVYNLDRSEAAKEFIGRWDADGDYPCVGGEEVQVSVARITELDDVEVFYVRGAMVPEYWVDVVEVDGR